MKKIFTAAMLLTAMGMSAQETYQNAEVTTEDLNGSAKYVGMGGAMEALGADMSAAAENPAALGFYRSTVGTFSFGLTSHQNGGNNAGNNKTNVNLDQAGVNFVVEKDYNSTLNFGVGYRKTNNFNQMLNLVGNASLYTVSGKQYHASQNTLTYEKYHMNLSDNTFTSTDYLYTNSLMVTDDNSGDLGTYSSDQYWLNRERSGFINNFDLIVGGQSNNRIYWGVAAGVSDVHYKNVTEYTETLTDAGNSIGNVKLYDDRKITGLGFNIKAGLTFRPIEGSPFRLGLFVHTPTWYDLETRNTSTLTNNTDRGDHQNGGSVTISENYKYEIQTPWKFGASAATTISNKMAIGVTYTFEDYSTMKSKIRDEDYINDWGERWRSSKNDSYMNRHTENSLKGVSTLKVGLELKPTQSIAIRAGYNYVTPMYKEDAERKSTIDSPGSYYSSTTDYTNWKATNRYTCGLGYYIDNFTIDLAYQFATTTGNFKPYQNINNNTPSTAVAINNDRHQVICTLGYKF